MPHYRECSRDVIPPCHTIENVLEMLYLHATLSRMFYRCYTSMPHYRECSRDVIPPCHTIENVLEMLYLDVTLSKMF